MAALGNSRRNERGSKERTTPRGQMWDELADWITNLSDGEFGSDGRQGDGDLTRLMDE